MVWIPDGAKFDDVYNRFDRISGCDRQMDRQTSSHIIVRAIHMRREVIRIMKYSFLLQ